MEELVGRKQISCYITHTNETVHDIIKSNKDRSTSLNGTIHGTGPRYCPSIEDKVIRYTDKNQHHLFLEREGYDTNEIYLGGLSSSLPQKCTRWNDKKYRGIGKCYIMRYAYAIRSMIIFHLKR